MALGQIAALRDVESLLSPCNVRELTENVISAKTPLLRKKPGVFWGPPHYQQPTGLERVFQGHRIFGVFCSRRQ